MAVLKNKRRVQDRKAYEGYELRDRIILTSELYEGCEQLHTPTALLKGKEAVLRFRSR